MVTVEGLAQGEQQVVIRSLFVAVLATACAVPAYAGAAVAERTAPCGYRDDLVSSIAVDHSASGFAVHITPTDEARRRGPLDYTTGSGAVTADLWRAVQECVPDARGPVAESLRQQLECHVWLGLASDATGTTYDLESWRRPLAHPGLASYLRTQCLNARAAADPRGRRGPAHWRALWVRVGATLAGWAAAW